MKQCDAMNSDSAGVLKDAFVPYGLVGLPEPDALDPVLEAIKRDADFSLVEANLKLSTEQRAANLVSATRFIAKFRPLVAARRESSAK